jgi:hypothetical protein
VIRNSGGVSRFTRAKPCFLCSLKLAEISVPFLGYMGKLDSDFHTKSPMVQW